MTLSEEEKSKIEEEESYRTQVRGNAGNRRKGLGCFTILLIVFVGIPLLATFLISAINPARYSNNSNQTPIPTQILTPTTTQNKVDTEAVVDETNSKETRILQEQKAIAESLTKTALDLIANDRVQEAMNLYNGRWNELTKLRGEILYDKELTDAQKENIDRALKGEQEGITNILSKYQQVYQ